MFVGKNNMATSRRVYTAMGPSQLESLLTGGLAGDLCSGVVIRFSATWCKPCGVIKDVVDQGFATLPDSVIIVDLDIDETIELYGFLTRKRMVRGVPTLLFYDCTEVQKQSWHIPQDSVSGGNCDEVSEFLARCKDAIHAQA